MPGAGAPAGSEWDRRSPCCVLMELELPSCELLCMVVDTAGERGCCWLKGDSLGELRGKGAQQEAKGHGHSKG